MYRSFLIHSQLDVEQILSWPESLSENFHKMIWYGNAQMNFLANSVFFINRKYHAGKKKKIPFEITTILTEIINIKSILS